jgi:hypothetical protein
MSPIISAARCSARLGITTVGSQVEAVRADKLDSFKPILMLKYATGRQPLPAINRDEAQFLWRHAIDMNIDPQI